MAEIVKAKKKKVKLKLGMSAPSGGGKTLSSLFIAYGLLREKYPNLTDDEIWDKICVIDTENESASLYSEDTKARIRIGQFNAINLKPPYSPSEFIDAIRTCEEAGMEVAIIDSLTHAWAGEGGLLDKQANASKKTGNSYTAWREVTPLHNKLVDAILQSDIHVIATIRSKTDYVMDKDESGRTSIKKVGLAPIQRDGMEYEFTTFFDIDREHNCSASKDRTGLFDDINFVITPETGKKFMKWLDNGIDAVKVEKQKIEITEEEKETDTNDLREMIKDALSTIKDRNELKIKLESESISLNYNTITEEAVLKRYLELVKAQ